MQVASRIDGDVRTLAGRDLTPGRGPAVCSAASSATDLWMIESFDRRVPW